MRLTDTQMGDLAEYLCDTTKSLEEALGGLFGLHEDDLEIADHEVLDEIVFLCDDCGWWCEVSDMEGDQTCADCST